VVKTSKKSKTSRVSKTAKISKTSKIAKSPKTEKPSRVEIFPVFSPLIPEKKIPEVKPLPLPPEPEPRLFSGPYSEIYQMLWERRQNILDKMETNLDTPEGISIKGDTVDIAQEVNEHELSLHLAEVESRELDRINMTLEKLASGTYGICESCGNQIAPARLKALPFAVKCIQCQEMAENW